MARYNEHKCLVCGEVFDYCRRCVVEPVVYKAEGFCSEKCSHIFSSLSKHSCNLATAEETLDELKNYDTTNVLENIKTHIDSLQPKKVEEKVKAEAKVEAKTEVSEDTISKTKKRF